MQKTIETTPGTELKSQSEAEMIAQRIEQAKSLHQHGDLASALQMYHSVLQQQPRNPDALHFAGVIAYQHKDYPLAEQLMQLSIDEDPGNAFYYSNLGMLYKDQGAFQRAVECQQKAIQLKPDYPEALLNLGAALVELEQPEPAVDCFQKSLALRPDFVQGHDNLGTALMLLNKYDEAEQCFLTALRLNPDYVPAYLNLAAVALYTKRFDEIMKHSLKALELDANAHGAYFNLGYACLEQGRFSEADQFLRHAIDLDPGNAKIRYLLGKLNLELGNLEAGWAGYEFRPSKITDTPLRPHSAYPVWSGESLKDKTILVWGEQGVGDQIMFASMYNDLIRLARHCIFACPKKLVPLFSGSFPQATVIDIEDQRILNELNSGIDVQSAAGSLARWLRPDIASFPREAFFLSADPDRVQYWRGRLQELGPELKVGISWRSGNMAGERAYYCSAITQWGPILSLAGVRFINLQYDDCAAELAKVQKDIGVSVQVFDEVDLFDDIAESAALTSSLDLVISAFNATGILAAALGVPTWVLHTGFDWQNFGTEHNCWYGRLQTFNKTWEQDWEVPIEQIAAQLRSKIPHRQ